MEPFWGWVIIAVAIALFVLICKLIASWFTACDDVSLVRRNLSDIADALKQIADRGLPGK